MNKEYKQKIASIRDAIETLKEQEKELRTEWDNKEREERQDELYKMFKDSKYIGFVSASYPRDITALISVEVNKKADWRDKYGVEIVASEQIKISRAHTWICEDIQSEGAGSGNRHHTIHEGFDYQGKPSRIYFEMTEAQYESVKKFHKKQQKAIDKFDNFIAPFYPKKEEK